MDKKYCPKALMDIYAALNDNCVKKGEPFTHTSREPSRSYYIGEDVYEPFMTKYCNTIRSGLSPTFTEKPGPYGPLRVDFDFRTSTDFGTNRQYDLDILKKIVGYYQEELRDAIEASVFEERMLWCIILEKKAPRVEDGKVKDGFHLHFPYFICEGWLQDEYLRERVTAKMIDDKIWKGKSFIEPVEKFIDTNMAKKQWAMYGSTAKKNGAEPFLVSKVLNENLEIITLAETFQKLMKKKKHVVEYYLPRFLSIRGYKEYTPLTSELEGRRHVYASKKSRKTIVIKKRSMEDVLEDIKIIKDGEIMAMLSDDRAEEFNLWMDVGWTLFNIGQGCDEALDLWIEFSKRSDKFVEGECEDRWAKMEMKGKTMASLFAMAKSDNPNLYKEWKDANVKTYLYKSLTEKKPNEWDMAQVILKLYKDRFVCADASKNTWYEFLNHRWQYMDDGITLKKLFATDVVELYYQLKADIANQMASAHGEDAARDKLAVQDKKCNEIITALKTVAFHKKLMEMCKTVFHDPLFFKKMDENRRLFVCENGVLDLENGIFRDGRPDDYMTLSCNVYYQKYTKEDDEWKELKTLIKKTFTNKNIRRYFKDVTCAVMEGGNINKQFIIGTGGGNNGKTITFNLLEDTFGEYAMKFPRNMLLKGNNQSSSGARPELARVRGKRLVVVQEVAKDEHLNIGVIKEYTGNDSFFARNIFEKGGEIKPMFTLFMQCLAEGTPVNLPCGISMPIEHFRKNTKVLSWNSETGCISKRIQKRFLDQGIKKCVKLTLLNGKTITCTPDHRFLSSKGEWVEAKDIIIGETELKMGPSYPSIDLTCNKDYVICGFKLTTLQNKLKGMALCRLLGYCLADGSMNKVLYMGHMLDAEQVIDDIELLVGKRPKICPMEHSLKINIPSEISRWFEELCPSQKGGRVNNTMVLPDFIFEKECPVFLITELLGGMFGGDGVIPCLMKNNNCSTYKFSPFLYTASKIEEHVESLVYYFQKLSDLIKSRFDISSNVNKPLKYNTPDHTVKYRVNLSIHSSPDNMIKFIEKIGVRFCFHKLYRLEAVLNYNKYLSSIIKQNEDITKRTKELYNKYLRQNPRARIGQYTLTEELIEIFDSTQKAENKTGINHSLINAACKRYEKSKKASSGGFIWKYHTTNPTVEDEEGFPTIKECLDNAIKEQKILFNKENLVTYTQVRNRILKGSKFTRQQFNEIKNFLEKTGLDVFCNKGGKVSYSLDRNMRELPSYNMMVIGKEKVGEVKVYDLTVEKPYSNFLANGIISHNCNEPPHVPGHDEATWNRIRILDYNSKFITPEKEDEFPIPKKEEDQYKAKRFKADLGLETRVKEMAPVMLSYLFERFKKYKKNGLHIPPEVKMSTNLYRSMNDVYLQFIQDRIEEVVYKKGTKIEDKVFLKLPELQGEFTAWYYETHGSSKEKFTRVILKHEFGKKLRNAGKKGRTDGWYGYKLIQEEPEGENPKELQDSLSEASKVAKVAKAAKIAEKEKTAKEEKYVEVELIDTPKKVPAKGKKSSTKLKGKAKPAKSTPKAKTVKKKV